MRGIGTGRAGQRGAGGGAEIGEAFDAGGGTGLEFLGLAGDGAEGAGGLFARDGGGGLFRRQGGFKDVVGLEPGGHGGSFRDGSALPDLRAFAR